jgi:hypothetical protein
MSTSRRVLLASLAAVSGAFGFAATAEASQGFGSFFWSGPYDGAARTQPYHGASPERYYVPSHKKRPRVLRGGDPLSHLSTVQRLLSQMRPGVLCDRSPVKERRLSSLTMVSRMSKRSFAQKETLSSVLCATGRRFRSRSKTMENSQRFSVCDDESSASGLAEVSERLWQSGVNAQIPVEPE